MIMHMGSRRMAATALRAVPLISCECLVFFFGGTLQTSHYISYPPSEIWLRVVSAVISTSAVSFQTKFWLGFLTF